MKKERITALIPIVLIIMIMLCIFEYKKVHSPSVSILTAPQMMFDEIIYALDNEDSEHLKSLFAPRALAQTPDIDEQIEDLMDLYKGKLAFNDTVGSGSASSHTHQGRYIYLYISPHISDLRTNRAFYSMQFSSVVVCDAYPEDVGLWNIKLELKDRGDVWQLRTQSRKDTVCRVGVSYN
ncbi:MAG: DUF5104 domain-containing protein [Oscillospiraceae bacterium]|nr:DUF5104 domain-containing protein [Oscillospiraceae bacterium]